MDIRPSPISGTWYPGELTTLQRSIDAYLEAAAAPPGDAPPDQIMALLAPHAGHRFSGLVAAHAFRAIAGLAVDTVVIACPSHFHDNGQLLTSGHDAYETPLGVVEIDRPAINQLRLALARALNVPAESALVEIRRDREHAIEIELPFLQRVLASGFRLLPLMLRDQSEPVMRALSMALVEALKGKRALLIASSDLSHQKPDERAREMDAALLDRVAAFDPAGVLAVNAAGEGQACGHGAIAATLWAARELGATQARVLNHATSGDATGHFLNVVGYAAAIMLK